MAATGHLEKGGVTNAHVPTETFATSGPPPAGPVPTARAPVAAAPATSNRSSRGSFITHPINLAFLAFLLLLQLIIMAIASRALHQVNHHV